MLEPRNTAAWLQALQEQARLQIQKEGLPTTQAEDWKYTSLDAMLSHNFQPAAAVPQQQYATLPPEIFLFKNLQGPRLVFIDGHYSRQHSNHGGLIPGLSFKTLRLALSDQEPALAQYFGKIAEPKSPSVLPLNTANLQDGVFLKLSANTRVLEPLQIIYVSTEHAEPLAIYPRHLILAGVNSSAQIIEHYVSFGAAKNFTCSITEVLTEAGAHLTHYKIQQEAKTAYHVGGIYVQQDKDSHFVSHALSLGARLSRNDIEVRLLAPGVYCLLNGLYMGRGRQHHDTHTRVDHLTKNGTSVEEYKGILDDYARAVFNGKVIVHPRAMQTDAQQSNKNLLLSNDAEIDTKPQLEIFADEVKCAHGATVGQLDQEALFFLRSRGLDLAEAKDLLVYGFASSVLDKIECVALVPILKQAILNELTP